MLKRACIILCTLSALQGCSGLTLLNDAGRSIFAKEELSFTEQFYDSKIKIDLKKHIQAQRPLRKNTNITVHCINKHVFILGQAPNEMLHDSVIYAINQSKYRSEITVTDFIRTQPITHFIQRTKDSVITTQVKTNLASNDSINSTAIRVITENGEVFLLGRTTVEQATKAVRIARQVKGVKKVIHAFEHIEEQDVEPQGNTLESSSDDIKTSS